MNLKKITQTFAERRRHQQGMRAAKHVWLLSDADDGPTPAEVVSLAFGLFRLRLSEQEAAEFLAAVLVEKGSAMPRPEVGEK